MAFNNKQNTPDASAIEALLPWHAAGTLNGKEAREVDAALARDRQLARIYAAIREECDGVVQLNESLGAPSPRVLRRLFAAIDAEPRGLGPSAHQQSGKVGLCGIAVALGVEQDSASRCPANDASILPSCICRAANC